MSFYHGVSVSEQATSVSTPLVAASGIPFVVGTAPVQSVDGKVNVPVLANSYAEAVSALGYSDDWSKYTLCEMIYSHFQLYGMSPIILLNVLDPATMKDSVVAADKTVTAKQIKLPLETIASTVVVKAAGGAGTAYVKDTDYALFYQGENLIIEVLSGGAIYSATSLSVAHDKVDPADVTATQIIGGYNTETKKTTGLECINQVLAMFGIVPDLILAPGFSHESTVAAAMATKAAGINSLFTAKALIDVDTDSANGADHYSEVPAWKSGKNITDKTQVLCWPLVKLGNYTFHMSTHVAGLMAKVDTKNDGCPYESPSNKNLKIDSLVVKSGAEVILDLNAANYLNANGVVTGLNFIGGFVLWGNETACFPASTDVKDYFICVSRMFGWVGSTVIQTYWNKVDNPTNKRLVNSIVDSINIWLNGLTSEEKVLGARVEFREEENPTTNLLAGKIKFHIYMAPPVPAREIDFVLEFDASYLTALFS
jgi:phage tail sheath protein FI